MSPIQYTGPDYQGVIENLLLQHDLNAPDGRPLHSYRLTEEQYDELQLYCMNALPRATAPYPALFVLWAAEHFRNSYDGSILRWRFLTEALEKPIERDLLVAVTSEGLRFWKRPLRSGDHHRLFLQSLLVEGGLPQELLKPEGRYRAQLLKLVGEAELRGQLASDAMPKLVWNTISRWPEGFRHEDVAELISDFVLKLVEVRRQIPSNIRKHPPRAAVRQP